MKFKIDENLPIEATQLLQKAGHDSMSVFDEQLAGVSDAQIVERCHREERALITLDVDFADIRTYPPEQFPGIIVLRLQKQDRSRITEVLTRLIRRLETETLESKLWIVEEERVRIRG